MRRPQPEPPGPGQESVWDYPRPPRIERSRATVEVVLGGMTVARTSTPLRVLETSHPPTYYLPATAFVERAAPVGGRVVLRVEGHGVLPRRPRRRRRRGAGGLALPAADGGVRRADRPRRGLPRADGPLPRRRRDRRAAARRVLRRLDHLGSRRPVQGGAGHLVLVTGRPVSGPRRRPPRPLRPPPAGRLRRPGAGLPGRPPARLPALGPAPRGGLAARRPVLRCGGLRGAGAALGGVRGRCR